MRVLEVLLSVLPAESWQNYTVHRANIGKYVTGVGHNCYEVFSPLGVLTP
jgi:hypothetical protein